jgi:hypothetical protein
MGLLVAGGFHCGIPWANGHMHFSRLGPGKIVNAQREAMLESHGGASSIRQSDFGRPPRSGAARMVGVPTSVRTARGLEPPIRIVLRMIASVTDRGNHFVGLHPPGPERPHFCPAGLQTGAILNNLNVKVFTRACRFSVRVRFP